jgi:hypothetical protein
MFIPAAQAGYTFKLGRIVHCYPETTNIAFGGDDWKTLYFTSRNTLGSVNLKIAGLPVPTLKKILIIGSSSATFAPACPGTNRQSLDAVHSG